ncbi:MAG: hypothetical protein AB1938_16330 [Myxococcota bacterium]
MRRAILSALVLCGACTRLDTLPGAYYPCHRDGGAPSECPGDWHCGLENRCLPNQPGAWACAVEADCFGWHCGAQGVCYPLEDAGNVPCRPDGGDCAPGWRCGVPPAAAQLSVCHDRAIGAPYLCHTDSDCEQQWRCGPDGVCLDAAGEALRVNSSGGVTYAGGEPPLWTGRPNLLSANNHLVPSCTGSQTQATTTHLVIQDELLRATHFPVGLVTCDDGGAPPRHGEIARARLPVGFAPTAMISLGLDALAVTADGGLWSLSPSDAGVAVTRQPISFAPMRLKNGLREDVALAFDGTRIARLEGGAWREVSLAGLDAGVLNDLDEFGNALVPGTTPELVLGTTRGLFRLTDAGVERVNTVDFPCDGVAPEVLVVSQLDRQGQRAIVFSRYPGASFTAARLLAPDTNPPVVTCEPLGGPSNLTFPLLPLMLDSVPDELAAISGGSGGAGSTHLLIAREGPNGLETRSSSRTASTTFEDWLVHDRLSGPTIAVSRGNPRVLAFADDRGRLWHSLDGQLFPMSTPLLTRAPAFVGSFDPLWAMSPGDVSSLTRPLDTASLYVLEPGVGFFSLQSASALGFVADAPGWLIFDASWLQATLVLDLRATERDPQGTLQEIARFPDRSNERVLATKAQLPDGGSLLVAGRGDLLLSADVTERVAGRPPTPTLRAAVVPLSRAEITSLVTLPPGAIGSYAGGYLLANGRIFRFRADNPVVWKTDELELGSAEAALVWADRDRARVALRDGAVYSLPLRVQLAPPFGAASTVRDLVDLCGNTFALANGALYRLEVDDSSPIGRWVPVTVPGAAAGELNDGRLHSDGTLVHLVTSAGLHHAFRAECAR